MAFQAEVFRGVKVESGKELPSLGPAVSDACCLHMELMQFPKIPGYNQKAVLED